MEEDYVQPTPFIKYDPDLVNKLDSIDSQSKVPNYSQEMKRLTKKQTITDKIDKLFYLNKQMEKNTSFFGGFHKKKSQPLLNTSNY